MNYFAMLAVCALALFPAASLAIEGGVEPGANDTRFDAVAAFGKRAELIGGNNHFGNGTLITPTKMLMARHIVDDLGPDDWINPEDYVFRFRRNPDGTLGRFEDGWDSFHHVAVDGFTFSLEGVVEPDLVIAHLAVPVTHIDPVPIAPPGFVRSGMDVTIAAWGQDLSGEPTHRLKIATNELLVADPDSPNGVNACSALVLDTANGYARLHDSGGGMFVMTRFVPAPYDYIHRDPVYEPPMLEGQVVPGGPGLRGVTPVPSKPGPVLVGVIKSLFAGTTGEQAFLHEVFEPELACECYRPAPRVEEPCSMHQLDFNGDYMIDEADFDLAASMWLGPCDQSPVPVLCMRLDDPDRGFGGNDNGSLDLHELGAYFASFYADSYCMCLEDVTGDGVVDIEDCTQVMMNFRECDCRDSCHEDINGDLVVDDLDLKLVMQSFGPCDH